MKIDEPFDGAVLNRRHGTAVDGGLRIRVSGRAPADDRVTVNGLPAERAGERFAADIVLREKETEIVAAGEGRAGRLMDRVRVVWDRNSRPRYRFAIDDNSFFLRDIYRNSYASLFDCFYLDMLRRLHRTYGAKFVLNVYFTTGDEFSLPLLPDRYRGEWRDNGDWLKLSFHARADKPDQPYLDASPERLLADFDAVAGEIHRFAGPEAYAPTTVVHWGVMRPEARRPLTTRGVGVLSGYFEFSGGEWTVNYLLDDEKSEYLSRHDAWMDFASGIVFSKIDLVCNLTPLERIVPTLETLAADPGRAEIMDFLTHEQYFWPFYPRFIPDHAQRLDAAIRWAADHGYEPMFLHEGFLGVPE